MTDEQEKIILDAIEDLKRTSLVAQKRVLTLDDVVLLYGFSKSTIYKMTSKKEIPHYRKGKVLFFERKEVEEWALQCRVNTVDEAISFAQAYIMNKEDAPEPNTYIVLDINTHLYKIGKAVDVERRLSGLKCSNPGLQLIAYTEQNVETELHRKLKEYNIFREWFNIPEDLLQNIIKKYDFKSDRVEFNEIS